MTSIQNKGKLFLIPNFLGVPKNSVLSAESIAVAKTLKYFIVEKEKTARKFLKQIEHPCPQSELVFFELNKHKRQDQSFREFFDQNILYGIGLISEAGMPCLADPGNLVVAYAHKRGKLIHPLVGPSSILLALISSGFNGQNFSFRGYLPIDKSLRKRAILDMEKRVVKQNETQIFMETPYRNQGLLEELIKWLSPKTCLHIACDIHMESQENHSKPIIHWKDNPIVLHKRLAVFCLGNPKI